MSNGFPVARNLLKVLDLSQNRDIFRFQNPENTALGNDLALGHTTSRAVVMSSSGKYWVLDIPNEMLDDLAGLESGLDVGDDVVPARDENAASAEQR